MLSRLAPGIFVIGQTRPLPGEGGGGGEIVRGLREGE